MRTIPSGADALTVDVIIEAEAWTQALPDAEAVCRRASGAAWSSAGFPGIRAEACVVLADDATVQRLNHTYRGQDRATDVLAFAQLSPGTPPDRDGNAHPVGLGDVVVALETTHADADAAGRSLPHHLSHLVIHGILHLLGYDHLEDDDAAQMEALEIDILAGLGIANPYDFPHACEP